MVEELIDSEVGAWKNDMVRRCFEEDKGTLILGLPMSVEACLDRVIWHYSKDGDYTVRMGYGITMEMQENGEHGRKGTGGSSRQDEVDRAWREIWSLVVPNKMKFFIWHSCSNSLTVKVNLIRRRI